MSQCLSCFQGGGLPKSLCPATWRQLRATRPPWGAPSLQVPGPLILLPAPLSPVWVRHPLAQQESWHSGP